MDIFKNFIIGAVAILVALVFFAAVTLLWPIVLGLGSIVFVLAIGVLMLVAVFYAIVLIGYLVRALISGEGRKNTDSPDDLKNGSDI